MINFLEGIIIEKDLSKIVLNVNGVGYEVFIPLSTYEKLPKISELCCILTHHHITEADQKLFGFSLWSHSVVNTTVYPSNKYSPFVIRS